LKPLFSFDLITYVYNTDEFIFILRFLITEFVYTLDSRKTVIERTTINQTRRKINILVKFVDECRYFQIPEGAKILDLVKTYFSGFNYFITCNCKIVDQVAIY
jgi:hypothetical protein